MKNHLNTYCCAFYVFIEKNKLKNFFEIRKLYCTYTLPNCKWNAYKLYINLKKIINVRVILMFGF